MVEAVVGGIVGAVVGALAVYFLPGLMRSASRRGPLDVHVEDDPAIIWAGAPPWVGAEFLMPDGDLPDPPSTFCPDWWAWAHANGGVDAGQTHVRVSLVGATDLTVVIDGIRATVHSRTEPKGQVVSCPAGGADIVPKHFEIQLDTFDPPTTSFLNIDGEPSPMPAFKIAKGEVEMLHIIASTEQDRVEWAGELLAIVNGKRQTIDIRPQGEGWFTTAATHGLPSRTSYGDGWTGDQAETS